MDNDGVLEEAEDGFDFFLPIQHHSRPISRMSGDLAFNSHALSISIDDTDIDHDLIAVARNLGIEIPEEPIEQKDEGQSPNVSAITVSSTLNESSISHSQTSNSTRPTSLGSEDEVANDAPKLRHIPIESLIPEAIPLPSSAFPSRTSSLTPPRAPSLAPSIATSRTPSIAPSRTQSSSRAPSIAPSTAAESVTSTTRSVFSVSGLSKRSSAASSFTKRLRRLSGLGKRKSADTSEEIEPVDASKVGRLRGRSISTPQLARPSTADGLPPQIARSTSMFTASAVNLPSHVVSRKAVGSFLPSYNETRGGRGASRRPLTPTIEEEDLEELRLAQERSLRSSHLQKLRAAQLEEQAKFMQEYYAKKRKCKDEAKVKFQKAQEVFEKRRDDTMSKHGVANMELEMRHLHAELELERLLATQRRACETRLKYMEAYCHGYGKDDNSDTSELHVGYPARQVTEDDYKKLVEQYNLRNGMETLHRSRINVLREQQAQQANRVSIRQDGELAGLSTRHNHETTRLKTEADRAAQGLEREYVNRKFRMIWRWQVKEAIERRRLELERGQVFGELPHIPWPEQQKEQDSMILAALSQGQRLSFLMS